MRQFRDCICINRLPYHRKNAECETALCIFALFVFRIAERSAPNSALCILHYFCSSQKGSGLFWHSSQLPEQARDFICSS